MEIKGRAGRFDDAKQGEWEELIAKLRAAGHEVGEPQAHRGDSFKLRVPVDDKLCTYPEAQEILLQDKAK